MDLGSINSWAFSMPIMCFLIWRIVNVTRKERDRRSKGEGGRRDSEGKEREGEGIGKERRGREKG